jgi:hypothetical protein
MNPLTSIRKDGEEKQYGRILSRLIVIIAALYLSYIGLTCPCGIIYQCHLMEMYIAIIIIVAVLMAHNDFRFFSYTGPKK